MTNKERYKRALNTVLPDEKLTALKIVEKDKEISVSMNTTNWKRRIASICAIVAILVGSAGVAYAANIGGLRRSVDSWLYGEAVAVEIIDQGKGEFVIRYPNGYERKTGGLSFDSNGNPVPFTVDDVIETMDDADIVEEDEKILLCLRDHVFDITEDLQDDRTAKISVKDGILPTYITVTADMDGGYSIFTRHIG